MIKVRRVALRASCVVDVHRIVAPDGEVIFNAVAIFYGFVSAHSTATEESAVEGAIDKLAEIIEGVAAHIAEVADVDGGLARCLAVRDHPLVACGPWCVYFDEEEPSAASH